MKWLAASVVLVALAIGGAFVYRENMRREQERQRAEALATSLTEMRAAITKYHSDTGRYPSTLQQLVPNYLRRVPVDPITNAQNWRYTTEETVTPSEDFIPERSGGLQPAEDDRLKPVATSRSVIIDVHSSAPGADPNGRAWSDY
ncbi:MAG TPA: hypothetical protein VNA69_19550 [Thermoanaerobaculia bacterium]|nr:hypothetical protein [Thermoanaerobaculia bacterium]